METKNMINIKLYAEYNKNLVSILDIDMKDPTNKKEGLAGDKNAFPLNDEAKKLLEGVGEWAFVFDLLNTKDFKSREEFDEWALRKDLCVYEERKIETFNKLGIEISSSIRYYLNHRDEIVNDLKTNVLKSIGDKQDLIYKEFCNLLGNSGSNTICDNIGDKLEDVKSLNDTGHSGIVTAKRGEYYLRFKYYYV